MSSLMCADHYSIRKDYKPLPATTTLETVKGSYWTPERLRISSTYQYDVYRTAYALATATSRIVDVGCGPATKHKYFRSDSPDHPSLTLIDQPSIRKVANEMEPDSPFVSMDLENPTHDIEAKFDIVICADVLEHLLDPDPCIHLLKCLSTGGGRILISTPDRDRLYGPDKLEPGNPFHVREWNFGEFSSFLESRGLKILEHLILHQKRPRDLERLVDPWLDRLGIRMSRYSCQLAVCTVTEDE